MPKVTLHRLVRSGCSERPRRVWVLRWYGTDINPETGNSIRYSETIGDAGKMFKRDAESIRRAKQSKLDCRMVRPDKPKRVTLAELAAHDRLMIADRRYKTLLGHDHAIGHAIKVLGSKARADRITRADVAKLKARMKDGDYSPATIDKVVRTLRAMWNRAKVEGFLVDNPFAGNGVRWDPRDSRIFTAEEINAMVEAAPDDWWRLFIRVLATTGLRLNEALHLRWCDVDLDAASVKVCRPRRRQVHGRRQDLSAAALERQGEGELPHDPAAGSDGGRPGAIQGQGRRVRLRVHRPGKAQDDRRSAPGGHTAPQPRAGQQHAAAIQDHPAPGPSAAGEAAVGRAQGREVANRLHPRPARYVPHRRQGPADRRAPTDRRSRRHRNDDQVLRYGHGAGRRRRARRRGGQRFGRRSRTLCRTF